GCRAESGSAWCEAAGGDGGASTRVKTRVRCHSAATTLSEPSRVREIPLEPRARRRCDPATCGGSLLLGSVLAGTLTGVDGYARTYVSEREKLQSPTPAGVRAARSGGAGNIRRGSRGVRPVWSDAVREPAGPSRDRRARGRRRAPR